MLLTPNKLNYGSCPHCKFLLNEWGYIPADAVGSRFYQHSRCPNDRCGKKIVVRVLVTFDVEVEIDE